MKIVEVTCKGCKAKFETLEGVPKNIISCPSCDSKDLNIKVTKKEFKGGCGGGPASNCSSLDESQRASQGECADCSSCGQ